MSSSRQPGLLDLVGQLLEEQHQLQTPVAVFADEHARGSAAAPLLEPVYSTLIPLTGPKPGEQYAFEVDLDACTGCKACVSGCHSLNGLDETETWRDVGAVYGTRADGLAFQQTVTSACHHCLDPGCLTGCPVQAYEKDPISGIVSHLDDQCIGCSYCLLTCPYDVPTYSERLGIVRKCDMCQGRLAAGEAPACVQACPTHAIAITTVAVAKAVAGTDFLPSAPDPRHTKPTTRYVSARPLPDDLRPADAAVVEPQHTHWPLVLLLVCSQAGIGASLGRLVLDGDAELVAAWTAVLLGTSGLAASVAHLGRPERMWRVFLGLRTSWLSREAIAIGGWLPLLVLAAIEPSVVPGATAVAWVAAGVGMVTAGCSAMVYIVTPRAFWRSGNTIGRMASTVLIAALLGPTPVVAAAVLVIKLAAEMAQRSTATSWGQLLRGPLAATFRQRVALGVIAAALMALSALADEGWLLAPAAALALGGELLERALFFRAVDVSKMPGVPAR